MSARRRRLPPGQIALAALAVGLAGLTFQSVFAPSDVVRPIAVAVLVPLAVALVIRGRRAPHLAVLVLADLVALPIAWLLATPERSGAMRALLEGLIDGWDRILSSTVPVPPDPAMLVVPFALVFAATAITLEVVLRTRRVLLTVVPALIVSAAGFLLGVDGPGRRTEFTVAFVLASVGLVLARARSLAADPLPPDERTGTPAETTTGTGAAPSPTAPQRAAPLAAPVAVVVAVAGVALLVATGLPGLASGRAYELHDRYDPDDERQVQPDPLDRVGALYEGSDAELFSVELNDPYAECATEASSRGGLASVDFCPRFPVAVYDRFDGGSWSGPEEFRAAGSSFPPPTEPVRDGRRVTQRVTVATDLPDPVVPTMTWPREISGLDDSALGYDAATGRVVTTDGEPSAGRYTVTSEVSEARLADIPKTSAIAGSGEAFTAPLEDFPNVVEALMFGQKGQGARDQLDRMQQYFFAEDGQRPQDAGAPFVRKKDDDALKAAPTGTNLEAINLLLAPPGEDAQEKARQGAPRDFTVAFATIAKALGFPTRVVVGYIPVPDANRRRASVTTRDLMAWPEVRFEDYGWVPIDVWPIETDPAAVTTTTTTTEPDSGTSTTTEGNRPGGGGGPTPGAAPLDSSSAGWSLAQVVVVVLGSLLSVLAILALAVRLRRNRARKRGTAAGRVAAAWRDAMRQLRALGVLGATRLTTQEAIDEASVRIGDDGRRTLIGLGDVVDGALHDRPEPDERAATEAWSHADDFRRMAQGRLPWWRRLLGAWDIRPLTR